MNKLLTALKAIRELGPTQVSLLALYKLGLKSGHYRRSEDTTPRPATFNFDLPLPEREKLLAHLGPDGLAQLRCEADEIVSGHFRAFGGLPAPIQLAPPSPQTHWTELEMHPNLSFRRSRVAAADTCPGGRRQGKSMPTRERFLTDARNDNPDIKLIWEPARFGWAFTLARAWQASGDEAYPAAFWRYFETFEAENPPFFGENWTSAQEVGFRLIAFAFAGAVFRQSEHTTPIRLATLAVSIGQHASRIVPTLVYARAQNNNHLLTEAAALYTAGLALPDHPQAENWRKIGIKWLNWCFKHQIDSTGEYVQHSANYHRLMLQMALWVRMVSGKNLRPAIRENLSLAAHWLFCLLDFESGKVPNLGPNDGAYIFPFTNLPIQDYRPVVQAAARAFLGYSLPPGPWDEMALWFNVESQRLKVEAAKPSDLRLLGVYPTTLQAAEHSWAYLRTARLRSRPGHADLLHLDLWWRGQNITLDPGTFHYNAAPPWDNPLTSALFHNTVTVDGRDQFTRASRFLYLDRADATRIKAEMGTLSARHYAYRKIGVRHTRIVSALTPDHWRVEDELLNLRNKPHTFCLHWLLPDGEYELERKDQKIEIRLKLPVGWLILQVSALQLPVTNYSLIRAGDPDPLRGWFSPTYSVKVSALSLAIEAKSAGNIGFVSEFIFSPA